MTSPTSSSPSLSQASFQLNTNTATNTNTSHYVPDPVTLAFNVSLPPKQFPTKPTSIPTSPAPPNTPLAPSPEPQYIPSADASPIPLHSLSTTPAETTKGPTNTCSPPPATPLLPSHVLQPQPSPPQIPSILSLSPLVDLPSCLSSPSAHSSPRRETSSLQTVDLSSSEDESGERGKEGKILASFGDTDESIPPSSDSEFGSRPNSQNSGSDEETESPRTRTINRIRSATRTRTRTASSQNSDSVFSRPLLLAPANTPQGKTARGADFEKEDEGEVEFVSVPPSVQAKARAEASKGKGRGRSVPLSLSRGHLLARSVPRPKEQTAPTAPAPAPAPPQTQAQVQVQPPGVEPGRESAPVVSPNQPHHALSANQLEQDSHRTPNVYINGLPPRFPESELYALAVPFGGVRSVRCFTRWVGERSSGYGFVLFDNIESAERCIEGLKKTKHLHPSFSKMHKIPGTEHGSDIVDLRESSFRTRMDKLKDETSTNLYFEGLPLSIDEPTLAALVSPYKIKSSRFFQTKLSHPPRIIAFVRLESRTAAEEIIERLHGRMVRGWNDAGARISVRFADTAEQRDLRRMERTSREDQPSPARLTMAQAALLNLRGQELPLSELHTREASLPIDDFKVVPGRIPSAPAFSLPRPRDLNPDLVTSVLNEGYGHDYPGVGEYCHQSRIPATSRPQAYATSAPQTHVQRGLTQVEERILQAHANGQFGVRYQARSSGPEIRGSENVFNPSVGSRQLHGSRVGARTNLLSHVADVEAPIDDFHSSRPYHHDRRFEMASNDLSGALGPDHAYSTNQHNISHYNSQVHLKPQSQIHLRSTTAPTHLRPFNSRQHYSTVSFPPSSNTNTNNINRLNPHDNTNTQKPSNYSTAQINTNANSNYIRDGVSEQGSSPMVSPALTYASRGSSSTLSPATPFFGSFAQAHENFGINQKVQTPLHEQVDYEGLLGEERRV